MELEYRGLYKADFSYLLYCCRRCPYVNEDLFVLRDWYLQKCVKELIVEGREVLTGLQIIGNFEGLARHCTNVL